MKISEIYSTEFKDSCLAFIRKHKLHTKIRKFGYSISDFVENIRSNAFLTMKEDNKWNIGTITGNLIVWQLSKYSSQYPDTPSFDLDSLPKEEKQSPLDIEDFNLSWQEQLVLQKLSYGHTTKYIAESINQSLHLIVRTKKSAFAKLKRSEKA